MAERQHCLVLGASGTVGMELCRWLRQRDWQVTGAARFSNPGDREELETMGVRTLRYDVTEDDPGKLPADVEVVFLEIWDPSRPDLIWPINFEGVGRVIGRYAGTADFVNGSTGSLYGPRADRPSRETDPPRPQDEYGLSRFAQEKMINFMCAQSGSKVFHLRYFHANDEDAGMLRRLADRILNQQPITQTRGERVQTIGLGDFVRCTGEAAQLLKPSPQVVNICHPRIWTVEELTHRIHAQLGQGKVIFAADGPAENVPSIWGDPTRMIQTFGGPTEEIDELIARVCQAALEDLREEADARR